MAGLMNKLNPLAIVIIITIIAILFIAFVLSIIIRKKYKGIGQALEERKKSDENLRVHNVIDLIVDDFERSMESQVEQVNTQAIIEKNFNKEHKGLLLGERFIKHSVSLMIILGLLGTFYGLTLSIGKLVELLSNSAEAGVLSSMDSVVGGLISSVKGMSVAFITSLFGIASSIVITIVNILCDIPSLREEIMVEIEEYLDNDIASKCVNKSQKQHLLVAKELKSAISEFGGNVERNYENVIKTSSKNLAEVSQAIQQSSASLLQSVQLFNESLKDFKDNTRDFSEFNHHLKTNIQRMNVSFSDFTDDLKKSTDNLSDGYKAYKELAVSIDKLSHKLND